MVKVNRRAARGAPSQAAVGAGFTLEKRGPGVILFFTYHGVVVQMFDYFRFTRTTSYSFLAALPLLVGYEVLIVIANHGKDSGVRVTADVWTKSAINHVLEWLGVSGNLWLGAMVLVAGVVIFVRDGRAFRRRSVEKQVAAMEKESPDSPVDEAGVTPDPEDDLEIRPLYFVGMLVESLVLAIVLASVVTFTVKAALQHLQPTQPTQAAATSSVMAATRPGLVAATSDASRLAGGVTAGAASDATASLAVPLRIATFSPAWWQEFALSLGAGLYEELLFRVLLMALMVPPLTSLLDSRVLAWSLAALVSALAFSGIHYIGAYGDPFQLNTFVYRFVFGLALQSLMAARGFAVAAWTHAMYDVLVVSGMWG